MALTICLLIFRITKIISILLSIVVVGINLLFVINEVIVVVTGMWWQYLLLVVCTAIYLSLLIYLILGLLATLGCHCVSSLMVSKEKEIHIYSFTTKAKNPEF